MKKHIDNNTNSKNIKREYLQPKLVKFGSITDITNSTATTGMGDGSKQGLNKTSV